MPPTYNPGDQENWTGLANYETQINILGKTTGEIGQYLSTMQEVDRQAKVGTKVHVKRKVCPL